MADNILWKGPRLLVPVTIEALVVSKLSQNQAWAIKPMDYNQIGRFNDVQPNLSAGSTGTGTGIPGQGITLHWALPDGFSHGQEQEDGSVVFPYVPNRWLLVRNVNGHTGENTAWVIESDYSNINDGTNLYPDYDNASNLTKIGKVTPLADWSPSDQEPKPFLQALGPGYPGFAAYTADIKNVFSFYDPLESLKSIQTPINYSLVGWYSDPSYDPLYNITDLKSWQELMQDAKWSVGDDNDLTIAEQAAAAWFQKHAITVEEGIKGQVAAQTLCQGFVFDVNWLGYDGALQTGVPSYKEVPPENKAELPQLAVGNSAIDAFAQLVQQELEWNQTPLPGIATFLQKFQYNLLDDGSPDLSFDLAKDIRDAWFGSNRRGKYWIVNDPSSPDPPDISDDIARELNTINSQQLAYEDAQEQLLRGQQNLYSLWWKKSWAEDQLIKPDNYQEIIDKINNQLSPSNPDSEYSKVNQLMEQVNAYPDQIEQLVQELQSKLPSAQKLLEQNGSKLWEPNDPVMVLYGAKKSYKYGEDDRFSIDGLLFTRFTGQNLTGIKVTAQNGESVVIDQSNIDIPSLSLIQDNTALAEDILDMTLDYLVENFFLDTNNAKAIADKALELLGQPADPSLENTVKKQQTLVWNADAHGNIDEQTIAQLSGLQSPPNPSKVPSLIGVKIWTAPWSPLYLAWEIEWYPSYKDPSKALNGWTFDPQQLDYTWDSDQVIDTTNKRTYNWYSVLTANNTTVLKAQLEQYFEKNPNQYPDLEKFLNNIAQWDFIAQSASGFTEMLLGWNPKQLNPIQDNAALQQLVGTEDQLAPVPNPSPDENLTGMFMPIRAGHFRISKAWILDDFGQVFDLISDVGGVYQTYDPVFGDGLEYSKDPTYGQLPPRLAQDFNLNFSLISANDDTLYTITDPSANPVCGWILPNHIDNGITVYDASGKLLGEILLVGGASNRRLRWDASPGKNQVPVGTPLDQQIQNTHLYNFVNSLINLPDSAAAYQDFIQAIDSTMWTIDPLGGRGGSNLSLLVGRPLALVRGSLNYHLGGGVVYDQQWAASGEDSTEGYDTLILPVQLGSLLDTEDGLLGYYLGEDFTQFNTLHAAVNQNSASSYLANNKVEIGLDQAKQFVTMIVDPRGHVNAVSAVLPIEEVVIPSRYVDGPVDAMEVTFRTGPLITEADMVVMPLPAQIQGTWSWIQHTGVTTWLESDNINKADGAAALSDKPNVLKEGWLKLADALGQNK